MISCLVDRPDDMPVGRLVGWLVAVPDDVLTFGLFLTGDSRLPACFLLPARRSPEPVPVPPTCKVFGYP